MTAVLEFNNVVRSFKRNQRVLDGVTFAVEQNDVVGLLGRNGAGKTTLIQIAIGMLYPHEGSVRVFGMSPVDQPVEIRRRIGYVAEEQVLPNRSRIGDILALHRRLFPTWDRQLERELLHRFGLAGNDSTIGKLSKGQARQVALICAVAHRPELLILDEPAGGLDPAARREFLETSIQLLNSEGTAILFSSHHMTDVERLGGRVVLLDGGRVLIDRALDDVREQHCVAVFPRSAAPDESRIAALPGCRRVRSVSGTWHVLFEGAPRDVRRRLQESLGVSDVQCSTLSLEELFIEVVGGQRIPEFA